MIVRRRRLARRNTLLVTAVALIGFVACGKKDAGDAADAVVTPVVTVETAPVIVASFTPTIRAVGTVVSSPKGYAELSAPAPSRVARVLVTAGQQVRAGDVLIQLDAAALQASASGASAAREAAQRAYDRAVRLAQEGILPRKAVDQASSDLAQANATDVGARRMYALSTLRAPLSGVVTKMNAVTGASVDASQVLVAVADPHALQILLQLSPTDAAGVTPGAVVTLFQNDTPSASTVGNGVVVNVGAAIDSLTRTVPIRVRVVSSTRPLRLGETLAGKVAFAGSTKAISIPATALVPDSAGFKVYVVRGGVAYSTSVEIGTRGDSLVQITRGLAAGQSVVTTGAYGLEDSSKVTVPKR
ncbi:MAG: efflux RND transporter periplasmic adaptor subunit [Gemmatimonadota bacterium]|nr:efflux RND transporter periplasmic adaptor subunit [Gemmatimonadota bacterium]